MQVKIRKYMTGTFVETYEATFEIPDDVDPDDAVAYLEENDILDTGDWEDLGKDDNIDNVEYEFEDIIDNQDED